MIDDVTTWIAREIDESDLDDDAGLIVLAALEGDHELDAGLEGNYTAPPATDHEGAGLGTNDVFLRSIQATGFRGIGPDTRIDFQPGPGLTIIAGRNGSGKSSLAEACELALTGGTYRWDKRAEQWREQWRNLHHHGEPAVAVTLVEQARGPLTITARWPDGATDVDTAEFATQRKGEKKSPGTGTLGWTEPLARFRPMLSYDELGGLLDGRPSALYDAIANILGVERVTDALARIKSRLKEPKKVRAELTKQRKALLADAKTVADERAAEVAQRLRSADPELAPIRSLVADAHDRGGDSVLSKLRALMSLRNDWLDSTSSATAQLRAAVTSMANAGGEIGELRLRALDLRSRAGQLHEQFGDQDCPVCGVGRLDAAWAAETAALGEAEQSAMATLTTAQQDLRQATRRVHDLQRRTVDLITVGVPGVDAAVERARTVMSRWHDGSAEDDIDAGSLLKTADRLDALAPDVAECFDDLVRIARDEYEARQQVWEPLAVRVAAWCAAWDAHQAAGQRVAALERAEKWLTANDLRLKNERIAPLRDHARRAWSLLRQESNVEINDLSLEGSSTRRRIKIDTTVDGTDSGGIAVLSQGEMHALSLALFLPRATMVESPFRFVVLDDPVQAMDPAKVDGLVELLSDLAETRQIIVFTHDNRLPDAARRARVGARIIEVVRGSESVVTVRSATDPATRYLSDAGALVKDTELPEVSLRRTLPGLLRFAVESAARERYFQRRLEAGAPVVEVDDTWQANPMTRARVSLALYGEVRPHLDSWLDQKSGYSRRLALGIVGPGMHGGLKQDVDPGEAVAIVRRVVDDLRATK